MKNLNFEYKGWQKVILIKTFVLLLAEQEIVHIVIMTCQVGTFYATEARLLPKSQQAEMYCTLCNPQTAFNHVTKTYKTSVKKSTTLNIEGKYSTWYCTIKRKLICQKMVQRIMSIQFLQGNAATANFSFVKGLYRHFFNKLFLYGSKPF